MSKVLFVATVDEHIRHFHLPYIKWFAEQGYEVHVASNGTESFPYCSRKIDLPFQRKPFSIENIRAAKMLEKLAEENRYELIHFHTPVASFFGRWAVRKSSAKVLYTAHGFHFYTGAPLKNWLLYYPAEWLAARWTDAIITINREDEQRARRFCKKVHRIPGIGVDTERFSTESRAQLDVTSDAFVVLSVGELIERKNHRVGIEAVAMCHDQRIHYCIAGRGPLEAQLKKLAVDLGVANQVHFLGYRTDLPQIYRAADVFLFPSKQEGLPVALIEAMAEGLPCVASRVRGNCDLLREKEIGLLCNTNLPQEFAENIRLLFDQPLLRKQLGEAARSDCTQYDIHHTIESMAGIYLQFLPAVSNAAVERKGGDASCLHFL